MLLHNEAEAQAYVEQFADEDAMSRLHRLALELRAANQAQNLVAAASIDDVWVRHIADSAQLIALVPRETEGFLDDHAAIWMDLGTGAGFPGLVIAALRPDWEVRLIESRKLRIQWLEDMTATLGLSKCRVIGQDLRRVETFEATVISARAFAPLPRLIEISARFSTNATVWLLPKGRSAAQDIAKLPRTLQKRFHVKHSVTDEDAGIVVGKGWAEPES